MAWAEDVSAFGQHQKFLLHVRKPCGTLGKRKAFLVGTKWVSCASSVAYQITRFTSSCALEKSSRVIINFVWT